MGCGLTRSPRMGSAGSIPPHSREGEWEWEAHLCAVALETLGLVVNTANTVKTGCCVLCASGPVLSFEVKDRKWVKLLLLWPPLQLLGKLKMSVRSVTDSIYIGPSNIWLFSSDRICAFLVRVFQNTLYLLPVDIYNLSHYVVWAHVLCGKSTDLVSVYIRFSSVTQSCPTLCDPMDCSLPGLPDHHQLPEFTQTHVHWISDAIQPSHSLSSPPPPAFNLSQYQDLFQWVRSSHQLAKVLDYLSILLSFHIQAVT